MYLSFMNLRLLQQNDYNDFFKLINDFRETSFSYDDFNNLLETQKHTEIYILEINNKIIGSGTLLYEKKFIHNISLYAHIEDIIIKKEYQGKGYGKTLLLELINICKNKNCFKILLDCQENLIKFYENCGFQNKGYQMVIYL